MWPWTVSWVKHSPQSMQASCRRNTKLANNHIPPLLSPRDEHETLLTSETSKIRERGGGRANPVGGAGAEVAGELGLLEVVAAVLALEPHHCRRCRRRRRLFTSDERAALGFWVRGEAKDAAAIGICHSQDTRPWT